MDPTKKVEALEAEREDLKQLLKQQGISEQRDIAIRNQIAAIGNEITSLHRVVYVRYEERGESPLKKSRAEAGDAVLCDAASLFRAVETRTDDQMQPNSRLSRDVIGKSFDVDKLLRGYQAAVETYVDNLRQNEKRVCPLPTIVGVSGQGKTEALKVLYFNEEGIRDKVLAHYCDRLKTKADATLKTPTKIICLFATFNQSTGWEPSFESPIGALVSRLACCYREKQWSVHLSKCNVSLDDLDNFVRREVATAQRCAPDEVMVVYLVDELRKMQSTHVSELLNSVCSTMQQRQASGTPALFVTTCLDVDSVFAVCTKGSQRPLLNIPLFPCAPPDLDKIVDIVLSKRTAVADGEARKLRYEIHGTGGHYASIATAVNAFLCHRQPRLGFAPTQAIAVFRKVIAAGGTWRTTEEEKLTDPGPTLHELADSVVVQGVIYREVDVVHNLVTPAVIPQALFDQAIKQKFFPDPLIPMLLKLRPLLLADGANAIKSAEVAVPLTELIHAHCLLLHGASLPTLEDLWGANGAQIVGWHAESLGSITLRESLREGKFMMCEDAGCTHTSGTELITETLRAGEDQARFAFPAVDNYPSIEGVVTNFVTGRHSVVQLKMRTKVSRKDLRTWIDAVHTWATEKLKLEAETYYCVLYTTQGSIDMSGVRRGTIVVNLNGLMRLLTPLGVTPLIQELQKHADNEPPGDE